MRVYKNINGAWIQQGADIDGEAVGDFSGYSISLSEDGSIVAIGAYRNAGNVPLSNIGHVRVYSSCSQFNRFLNAILSAMKYGSKKVYICHKGESTLQVTYPALLEHLYHGDYLGQCGKANCDGLQLRSSEMDDYFVEEESESIDQGIVIFPNPAENMLNIKLPTSLDKPIQIQVINSLGQVLLRELIATSKNDKPGISINIQSIPEGYYFLSASCEEFKEIKPFMKRRY